MEATDTLGNVHKSDIQHVYVGQSNPDAPQPAMATFSPNNPDDCPGSRITVTYNPGSGPLATATSIDVVTSFNGGGIFWGISMTNAPTWSRTYDVPEGATSMIVYFRDGGVIDNNGGANWSTQVLPCPVAPAVSFNPAAPDGCGDVTITYQPGTGILADADPVFIHIGHDGWQDVLDPSPAMALVAPGTWEYTYTPVPGTENINLVFNDGEGLWDNNNEANYAVAVTNCVGPYDADACLVSGAPSIAPDPTGQNAVGENFDFTAYGGGLQTTFQGGFGSFGEVAVNYDAQYLYVGGTGLNVGEDRNGAVVFVGIDTLVVDAENLWSLSGNPQGLDKLHNVEFTVPMDLAIVLGDEYGDGSYPSFGLGSGYDFGQGVFTFGATSFVAVAGAQLAQFDGFDVQPTSTDDDDTDRITDRWEAAIPWSALNVSVVTNVQQLNICGLLLSDGESGPDRYISGNYLGASATSGAGLDAFNNFGFSFVTLTPYTVCLPYADGDADGLVNEFELRYFNHPGLAEPGEDGDQDGLDNEAESMTGTDPTDARSTFVIFELEGTTLSWSTVGGKQYVVEYTDELDTAFTPIVTVAEDDVAEGLEATETFADDLVARPLMTAKRYYRVRLLP